MNRRGQRTGPWGTPDVTREGCVWKGLGRESGDTKRGEAMQDNGVRDGLKGSIDDEMKLLRGDGDVDLGSGL